uniref:Estradiol 17-beta-dehydrogenase 12 n=1 Tax=Aegilops tauschii TaxID=37682 RepID=M8CEZ6_AEGTA
MNLVLVGRNPAKLRDISAAISKAAPAVQTKTVMFNLSLVSTAQGDEAMRRLRQTVEELDVGVLVNNAGVLEPPAAFLHGAGVEAWVNMIRVNLLALTEVTAAVIPGMVERGRGAVAPFFVTAVMASGFSEAKLFEPLTPTPDDYARAAVRWIGHGALCVPNLMHQIVWFIAYVVPDWLLEGLLLSEHLWQRKELRRMSALPRAPAGIRDVLRRTQDLGMMNMAELQRPSQ